MSQHGDAQERLLAIFRVEAREHLQEMVTHLLALSGGEADAAREQAALQGLFRAIHTLKGAARSVGLDDIEAPCQSAEDVMSRLVRAELSPTPALLDLLQDLVAHLARSLAGAPDGHVGRALINRLQAAAAAPRSAPDAKAPPAVAASSPEALADGTIRVSTDAFDAFIFRTEDLAAANLAVAERARQAQALAGALVQLRKRLGTSPELSAAQETARTLLAHLQHDALTIGRAVDELQQALIRIRMAPASSILDVLPLMVHDLSRENGKQIDFSIRGGELELDRRVLEAVKDPLIHLVRNAIDHGIEAPAVREAAGKPVRGRLTISLTPREDKQIEIRLADDGAGLDLEQVRTAALRARLLTVDEAAALTYGQAQDLVFRSGFTTSPIITRVSGRGLGMAIVRERVENLGGTVRLESEPKRGTAVTMVIPAAIIRFQGLLVRAGGQRFLIPLDAVERTWRAAVDQIQWLEGQSHIYSEGALIPCCRLRTVLELEGEGEPEAEDHITCVALASGTGGARAVLLVDEVQGGREATVKELAAPLVRVRNVAGAGVLGTGEVVLILRPADLVKCRQDSLRPAAPKSEPQERRPVVLVVDDSITTRTVEKNILEMAGFEVRVAADGVEAWGLLAGEPCDLVVSDVDMPRMDGFELTERIRAHPRYRDLPVVLVTALESRDDKEKGIRLGANAYLFKSGFEQTNLLETVRRLI
ncbi:MAG: response regulator [Thermaerobacter sp.]|nr:response regulator [Thermaerobacter sp.]